jgi:hypothetical protein
LDVDLVEAVIATFDSRRVAYDEMKEKFDGIKVGNSELTYLITKGAHITRRGRARTLSTAFWLLKPSMTGNRSLDVMLRLRSLDCVFYCLDKQPS